MARPGFLGEGSNTSYPLIHGGDEAVPKFAIADFGSVMLSGSGYLETIHNVYLHEIRRDSDLVEFDFRSDAPGLEDLALVFRRSVTDGEFVSEYVDAEPIAESSSTEEEDPSSPSPTCPLDPLWTGFMVSGDMQRLATVLADGGAIAGPCTVEPSRTQNLDHSYVRSIGVANSERTRATTAAECRDYCWAFPLLDHYVVCECLIGDVRLSAGYNADVRLEPLDNQLVVSAEVGGGLGEPCDEVPLFPGESPPYGHNLLAGGPACGEVIRSINGIGKQFLDISGGTGVSILAMPEAHRLIVRVDLHTMAICPDLPELEAAADLLESSSSNSCECGSL